MAVQRDSIGSMLQASIALEDQLKLVNSGEMPEVLAAKQSSSMRRFDVKQSAE